MDVILRHLLQMRQLLSTIKEGCIVRLQLHLLECDFLLHSGQLGIIRVELYNLRGRLGSAALGALW